MKYILKPAQLRPEVVAQLRDVPAVERFDEGKLLRHPEDTFAQVFRDLLENGIHLCRDHTQALSTPGDAPDTIEVDQRLRRSLRIFHTSIGDYIDGCRSVIYYVRPDDHKRVWREFRQATSPYFDFASKIDNFAKHQQRALRTVYAQSPHGPIVGYQVEGAIGVGAVGAERLIHRYPATAFSLNRALKYHACHIYLMAAALKTVLNLSAASGEHLAAGQDSGAATFLEQVAAIPMLFFPDEQLEQVPLVRKRTDGSFLLECPSLVKPDNHRPHVMNLNFRFSPTAHALQVEIPYMDADRPWERSTVRR